LGKVFLRDLVVHAIIGIEGSEREMPQEIVINVELFVDLGPPSASDDIADCVDYKILCDKITAHAQSTRRFTVEALAADVATIGLEDVKVERVVVRVEKPAALRSCRSAGVEIERSRER
jgi:7,8-dihydroneopterin aldolase/epimerase/oxygenase